MSQLLEQAVAEARKLPDVEQEVIAALILAEIEDERRWEESFARSPEKLKALADRAAEQVRAGQCRTDDGLMDELLANNPKFKALVEKSKASPRRPFATRASGQTNG